MKKDTINALTKALSIARATVDYEYSKNYLRASIDKQFASENFEHQTDLIELAEELEKGERDFKDYIHDNHN